MRTHSWNRRDVLKVVSAAALAAAAPRFAAAQSVKWSTGTEAPKLKAPANATDCHHHVYNAKYPVDPRATLESAFVPAVPRVTLTVVELVGSPEIWTNSVLPVALSTS